MVITALIRAAGLRAKVRAKLPFDEPWVDMWMQIEASAAVLLVSVTAFRSVFAPGGPRKPKTLLKAWYSLTARKRGKYDTENFDSNEVGMDGFPHVPLANLTGTHTYIQGGRFGAHPASAHDELDDDSMHESSQRIKVSHTLSHQVRTVDGNYTNSSLTSDS